MEAFQHIIEDLWTFTIEIHPDGQDKPSFQLGDSALQSLSNSPNP